MLVFRGYRQINPSALWEETMEVIGITTANSHPRFIMKSYNYHNNGLYNSFIVEEPWFFYTKPADLIGKTFYHVDSDGDLEKNTYPSYETLTVPAGTFETIKNISEHTTYIPGIAYEDHIFPDDQTCINWWGLDSFAMVKEV